MAIQSSDELLAELQELRLENAKLRKDLAKSESNHIPLSLEEFQRYGRQMIVEGTNGVEGQVKLKTSKVLVVGAGGLGCPVLPYLAGAGVGTIGIVDNDIIDSSNLHRQTLHDTVNVGKLKCDSARDKLVKLNSNVNVKTYPVRLDNVNAFEIFKGYDYVLDCTDTPLTRYLISDVAVILGITVVSASGLGYEGQLSILNFNKTGPCYRCYFPTPPSPNSVSSCSEGGVIGPCIGLVGTMMAVETLKLIYGVYTNENFKPFLIMYAGFPSQTIRTFKMRGRKDTCICCGSNPTITEKTVSSGLIDYSAFCGKRNYDVCQADERLSAIEYENYLSQEIDFDHILLDVRPKHHYEISHLPHSINVPVKELKNMHGSLEKLKSFITGVDQNSKIIVMCRYGNDSQLATRLLKDEFKIEDVKDVKGGFFKYIDDVNQNLPKY